MASERSELATAMDGLQAKLLPVLKRHGFRARGRTFNRPTPDGLTQVIQIQMGRHDPPGTVYIPGLTGNLYGKFTVNLGVYIPEVATYRGGGAATSFVQEYHCSLRERLRNLGPERADIWWDIRDDATTAHDLQERLERDALPFLERFRSRDAILAEGQAAAGLPIGGDPPRIVRAIILNARGQTAEARALLARQALESRNPGHPEYVRDLARKLGLGELEA